MFLTSLCMYAAFSVMIALFLLHTPSVHAQTVLSCARGMYCPTDISNITSNGQVAYYSFWSENRLADASGITGALNYVTGTAQYATDGQWTGSQSLVATTAMRIDIPNMQNSMYWTIQTGLMICLWYKHSLSNSGNLFYFGPGSWNAPFLQLLYDGTYGLKIQYYSGSQYVWSYGGTSNGALEGTWYHTCVSLYQNTIQTFWNANLVGTGDITNIRITPRTDNYGGIGCYYFSGGTANFVGQLDEFRVFNRVLSATEVTQIYNFREYPCPAGTANDLLNQRVCPPCPPNTYQPNPGQAVCLSCSSALNTYYGGTICPSSQKKIGPSAWQGASNTPGTATYTVNANSISFNCPSGSYSTTANTLTSMTAACTMSSPYSTATCTAGTCCIWSKTSIYEFGRLEYAWDGRLNTGWLAEYASYQFIGIDFLTSKYVDTILFFETTYGTRGNNIKIYIGDTLLGGDTVTPGWGSAYSYPTNNNANQLCYTGGTVDAGYRSPLAISCQKSGRYLYIVDGRGIDDHMSFEELGVFATPPCTLCPPGKYSHYTTANTQCTDCPVGTYSSGSGASTCTACGAGTFQPLTGQANCVLYVPPGFYVNDQTGQQQPASANLIAYYSFFSTGRTSDYTGRTGSLTVQGTITYQTDGKWPKSEAAVFNGVAGNYMTMPAYSLGAADLSICVWYQYAVLTNYQRIFDWGNGQASNNILMAVVTNKVNFEIYVGTTPTYAYVTPSTISAGTWYHTCITKSGTTWAIYHGGTLAASTTVTTNTVVLSNCYLGKSNWNDPHLNGLIDDFRIYNTALTAAQVADVYAYSMAVPCPAGSFQDLANQDTCKPCGIGFYSTTTGASSCTTACANCKWYGAKTNEYPYGRFDGSTTTYTPGVAQYKVGAKTITFNCPSGTYSPTVFTINPVRTTCGSCDAQCCGWAMDGTYGLASNAFDGDVTTVTAANWRSGNSWYAIDFKTSLYIDNVALFQGNGGWASNLDLASIYVGDQYYANPTYGETTPATGVLYDYPTNINTNTLCHREGTSKQGYRFPLHIQCKLWGRYLYVVTPEISYISEIIVTNTSICTPCSPGTYSYNTIPTVRCSQCPSGTYQSGVGKSYCDSCSAGTYQSGVGMTSADNCVGINSGLVAYYTFTPGARLKDSTGTTGDLTYENTVTPTYSNDGPWQGASSAVFTNFHYFNLPSMNIASLAATTGLSICLWYSFASTIQWPRVFAFGESMDTGVRLSVGRIGTSTTLAFYFQTTTTPYTFNFPRPIVLNQWRHMCITSASRIWKVYDDTVLVQTTSADNNMNNVIYILNWIGYNHRWDPKFEGSIDEFRIYNRALSAAEVLNIYNFRNFQANATAFCRAGDYCPLRAASSNANLIAYYSFWSDQPLLDATGVTGPLTVIGTPTYSANGQWSGSKIATLTGTQYYYLPSINIYQYSATTGFSICAWFMFTAWTTGARVFDFGQGAGVNNILFHREGDGTLLKGFTTLSGATYFIFPQNIVLNQWRHVCMVNQGRLWTMYDNGQPVLFQTATADLPGTETLTINGIGKSNWNEPPTQGSIDEFRIYNVALTADQVLDVYNFRNWQCPIGSYCPVGSSEPVPCPLGSYSVATGATACTRCSVGQYTLSVGSTSAAACATCA